MAKTPSAYDLKTAELYFEASRLFREEAKRQAAARRQSRRRAAKKLRV